MWSLTKLAQASTSKRCAYGNAVGRMKVMANFLF